MGIEVVYYKFTSNNMFRKVINRIKELRAAFERKQLRGGKKDGSWSQRTRSSTELVVINNQERFLEVLTAIRTLKEPGG